MSNSNQPETAAKSSIRDEQITAGSKAQHRSLDLRPRLRGNARGSRNDLNAISSFYPTNIGLRRVPRRHLPARPDAAMIRNARQGIMSKFLRSGIIIRASDLGSMVNPKSAIISLTDAFEMETDHLSDEADRIPKRARTLKNLFYICVQEDELPSYHFWRGRYDPDPVNIHRPIDWHGSFHSNSNAETKPAEYEHAKEQRPSKPGASNHNGDDDDSKQTAQLRSPNKAALPFSHERSDQYKLQDIGLSRPQFEDSGRETSPLDFQEPLDQGEDPKGSGHQGNEPLEFDGLHNTLQDQLGQLEFLDFYGNKSDEEVILYKRELTPGAQVQRELDEQTVRPDGHGGDRDKEGTENEKHSRHNSGLSPESVYQSAPGEIQHPHYPSTLDWEITGGPYMPMVYARVPTLSEIRILQRRVWRLENYILQREDYCRVCDQTFAYGASDIKEHYHRHRVELVCPCCQQDWRGKTRQDQVAHLALSHQLSHPLAQDIISSTHAKSAPKPTSPESEQERDLHGRIKRNPSQGWYCAICYTNVTTLGLAKQKTHAHNCKTSLQEFLVLTKGEVAQRKKAANSGPAKTAVDNGDSLIKTDASSTPSKAVRGRGKKRAKGTGAYRPEATDDSSSSESEEKEERKRKKRKSAAETSTLNSDTSPRTDVG